MTWLFYMAAGIAAGIVTGLLPGLHPNTVTMLVAASPAAGRDMLFFIVPLAVANTVADFIPSIFFGAPGDDNVLSVLPGHEMLMRGDGYRALKLTVLGGLVVTVSAAALLPFLLWALPVIYTNTRSYLHVILSALALLLLWGEKRKPLAAFFFLLSGLAGLALLSSAPGDFVLFPLLTGFFGLPTIMLGLRGTKKRIPQRIADRSERFLKGSLMGLVSGVAVGLLPGTGSAQAGVLSGRLLRGKREDFLVALGGINTTNMFTTFIIFFTLGKTRSGAAWALASVMQDVTVNDAVLVSFICVFSCAAASVFTLRAGRVLPRLLGRVDYRKLNAAVLAFLLAMLLLLSGPVGLAVALLCAVTGTACMLTGVKRMYLMGSLMLPTICYFMA